MTTVHVTKPYCTLKKEGDVLVIHIPEQDGQPRQKIEVPLIKVTRVVIWGDSALTPAALAALLEQKAEIAWLDGLGRFRGRLVPAEGKNSLLRLNQFRAHENPTARLRLARAFVRGKLLNARTLLMRAARKSADEAVRQAADRLREVVAQVDQLPHSDTPPQDPSRPQAGTVWGQLQGLEGAGTAIYFDVFGRLLRADGGLRFDQRNRRPPRDPVNALLSYAYTLLMHSCAGALQACGLDPYIGFLHGSQYGKPSLALDLMEEFRAPIADSVVLTLVNNRVLTSEDFIEEFGAVRLKDASRRRFLEKFEERMETEIHHPIFEYRVTYRRCLELQARLLARAIEGELDAYPPFCVR